MAITFRVILIRDFGEVVRKTGSKEVIFAFFLDMGEIVACTNADKNDPERRRKIILHEKEMMVTGGMSLKRSKEMRSKT